jgi:hypothetical protein
MSYPQDHDAFRIPVATDVHLNVTRYGYGATPWCWSMAGTSSFRGAASHR